LLKFLGAGERFVKRLSDFAEDFTDSTDSTNSTYSADFTDSTGASVSRQFVASRMDYLQESYIHPPFDYERELLEAIRLKDEQRAMDVMLQINAMQGATLAADPVRSKKNSLIASCTLFTRAVITGGVDFETAFQLSDACILEIEKIASVERLVRFEFDMLRQFIALMKRVANRKHYSRPIDAAITYISANIFRPLTLDDIARHIRINPCYLSDRFRRETGITVTAFIQKKKIDDSKAFLAHTQMSIAEIALLFHFCNQSYYTHLFKKYTGKTPREFRQGESTL
jgi:YesN/AraC family two-component response regulator